VKGCSREKKKAVEVFSQGGKDRKGGTHSLRRSHEEATAAVKRKKRAMRVLTFPGGKETFPPALLSYRMTGMKKENGSPGRASLFRTR